MRIKRRTALILSLFLALSSALATQLQPADIISNITPTESDDSMLFESMQWSMLSEFPALNDSKHPPRFSGVFSGLAENHLVIAGGTESAGGYNPDVYLLSLNNPSAWTRLPDALPHNLANGVSISLPQGLLLVGGANQNGGSSEVLILKISNGGTAISLEKWPSLPTPLSNMSGAMVGSKIYLAGGVEDLTNPLATRHFLVLDTRNTTEGWKNLEPWPGPPRVFGLSTAQSNGVDNCFYLFGGRNYRDGLPSEVLSDSYEYNPRLNKWRKLDTSRATPFPATAEVAFPSGANHIVLIAQRSAIESAATMVEDRTNPSNLNSDVYFFHTVTNTVVKGGTVSFSSPLGTTASKASGKVFIPSGKPGGGISGIITGDYIRLTKNFGVLNTSIMLLYFVVISWMGLYFSKRQKTTHDYFKAGGKMPWWVVALSIYGTTLSSITFMAIPAKAYSLDWSYLIYSMGTITAAPLIVLIFIPFFRKLNVITAYEYLEQRFNTVIRVIASIAFIIFQVGRMGIVIYLPSIALNVITGFDIFLCISLMGIVALMYSAMGGIEAVIWTDALQVIIFFGGAIVTIFYITSGVQDGFLGIISVGASEGKFHLADPTLDLRSPTLITALIATFFANLITYGTDQTIVQRYMTTPTQKQAVRSFWGKLILAVPGTLIFFFIGTALYVYYHANPSHLSYTMTDGDGIFPWFIFTQMPSGISGILVASIFAVAMSTISSSINAVATAYSVDIHFRFGWSPKVNDLKVAIIVSYVFGVIGTLFAVIMAAGSIVSLWDQFQKVLGLALGGLAGVFCLGMLTRRANATGALFGILGSVFVQNWVSSNQVVHVLLYVATGLLSSFVIGYAASMLTPKINKDITHLTVHHLLKKNKSYSYEKTKV